MSLRRSTLSLLSTAALLAACGDDPVLPDPTLTLTVDPVALTVELASVEESDVMVVRANSSEAVQVTVSGGGTGVTGAIQDVSHVGNTTTATLVVTVAGDAEPGNYTVTVRAANGDADDVTKAVAITVPEGGGGGGV
jgi:hypothetical protein